MSNTILKFKCDDRNYESWTLYHASSLKQLDKSIYNVNPIKDKLLNQDIIKVDDDGNVAEILHSSNREMKIIPGVMVFDKMYGKIKNKILYKVVPDDRRLPVFLVPVKQKRLGFGKKQEKNYVIFKYNNWYGKHPQGEMVHTIGNVKELSNFYEYQLYCKSLNATIQDFTRKAKNSLREYSDQELTDKILNTTRFNIEDRRDWDIISIDPETSKDYDDAFGITILPDRSEMLSIYISNVSVWMEFLGLWDSFTERISTIYLPDRKRPMLPTILSDMLCSLQENQTRFAFTCDVIIKNKEIKEYSFKNTAIRVKKNYFYEDDSLKSDAVYCRTINILYTLNKDKKFKLCDKLTDSHDTIMFLMILMNYLSAKEFEKHKNGIFRSIKVDYNSGIDTLEIPGNVKKFLMSWNSTGGQYLKFENYTGHDILKLDAYVHITSPIRRLVDMLNMIQLQNNLGIMYMSSDSKQFLEYWMSNDMINYINTTMRAIRKVQTQCDLLERCTTNPAIMDRKYEGYVFDRVTRNDGLYQYLVYIPELKLLNKYTSRLDHINYSKQHYKLYLFEDEDTFKKKIMFNFEE